MFTNPDAGELLAAVRMHLEQQVLPALAEPRLRFQTLVASNVLAIVERELRLGPDLLARDWQRLAALEGRADVQPAGPALAADVLLRTERLAAAIRAGQYDDPDAERRLLAYLQQAALDELRVANPRYRERIADV